MSDGTLLHGSCVCVQAAQKKSVHTRDSKPESPDGDVCAFSHTEYYTTLVSLVSIVLVLVWYQTCSLVNCCSTRSSTTVEVVK